MSQMNFRKARRLWVEALRSGDYEQGQHALCERGKFCCLGVACEVYQRHFGDLNVETQENALVGLRRTYDGEGGTPPVKVLNWLNINQHGRLTKPVGVMDDNCEIGCDCGCGATVTDLVSCNDDLKLSFDEIADIIEDGLLKNRNPTWTQRIYGKFLSLPFATTVARFVHGAIAFGMRRSVPYPVA